MADGSLDVCLSLFTPGLPQPEKDPDFVRLPTCLANGLLLQQVTLLSDLRNYKQHNLAM